MVDLEQSEENGKSGQEDNNNINPNIITPTSVLEEESKIDVAENFIIDKLKFWCNICKRDLCSDGAYKIHNKLAHRGNIATQEDETSSVKYPNKNNGTHSALKLEKSAISKVQKNIICLFKNGKK